MHAVFFVRGKGLISLALYKKNRKKLPSEWFRAAFLHTQSLYPVMFCVRQGSLPAVSGLQSPGHNGILLPYIRFLSHTPPVSSESH